MLGWKVDERMWPVIPKRWVAVSALGPGSPARVESTLLNGGLTLVGRVPGVLVWGSAHSTLAPLSKMDLELLETQMNFKMVGASFLSLLRATQVACFVAN